MIPYIVYAAMITAVCFLFYRLLLRRETFFSLNRWFFLGCLICSFSIPLLHVPGGWSIRAHVAAASTPASSTPPSASASTPASPAASASAPENGAPDPTAVGPFTSVATGTTSATTVHKAISAGATVPAEQTPGTRGTLNVVTDHNIQSMPVASTKPMEAVAGPAGEGASFSWFIVLKWVYYAYLFGVLIFGMNLLVQLLVLLFQAYGKPVIRDGLFRIIETGGNRAPCSFGHHIFINPSLYDPETFNQILSHEKIHVQQRHSVDILLAEICIVIQWFNPFAWYYRKALEDNLEFLTDAAMIRNPAINASTYQMSLLMVSAPHIPLSITSNYNQSLLKKRIVMMHVQKSSARTTWKYLFLLPLFTGLVCIFNDTIAGKSENMKMASLQISVGQQDQPNQTSSSRPQPVEPKIPIPIPIPAPNPDPQPVINVQTDVQTNVQTNVNVSAGDDDTFNSGTWMATIKGDEIELMLKSENGRSSDNSTFKKSEFSTLPTGHKADFTLTREAGTLNLNGLFDGDDGFGHYTFKENPEFRSFLEKQGITGVTGGQMFGVFITNVKKSYVESLAQNGYPHPSIHNLIAMSSMNIDIAYIQSCKQMGYPDLPIHDLIAMKSMNIDAAYIKDLQQGGFTNLAVHDVIAAKSMDVDAAYIQSWKQAGYKDLPMHDLISLKSMGIDGSYVQSWKDLGYTDLPAHELVSMKSVGVDGAYIKEMKEAGFDHLEVHELISLKSMGVTGAYVKEVQKLGDADNKPEVHEVIEYKSMGIDGKFVHSFEQVGYTHLSPHELVELKSLGITPDFIKGYSSIGFKDIPVHTLAELKSMDVSSEYVSAMKNKGFNSNDLQEYVKLKTFK